MRVIETDIESINKIEITIANVLFLTICIFYFPQFIFLLSKKHKCPYSISLLVSPSVLIKFCKIFRSLYSHQKRFIIAIEGKEFTLTYSEKEIIENSLK